MGLPEVKITFQENAVNFIKRLGRGMVAVPIINAAFTTSLVVSAGLNSEIEKAIATVPEDQKEAVKKVLESVVSAGANKCFVVCGKDAATIQGVLEGLRFNWLAIGECDAEAQTALVTWAKEKEFMTGRAFIMICGESLATEKEGHIVALDQSATTHEDMTSAFIAGVFAGLSDRSGTYYVVDDNTDGKGYATKDQANTKIDAGILTVFFDGEKAKIGRAITTIYATDKKSAFAKIRNVDTMNMIMDDIRDSFYDQYVGQVLNDYDHKMSFIGQLNQVYLKGLEGEVLDSSAINKVDLDLIKHSALAIEEGLDVSQMSEQQLRELNTGSSVYLSGQLKLLDSIEDLYITFTI